MTEEKIAESIEGQKLLSLNRERKMTGNILTDYHFL